MFRADFSTLHAHGGDHTEETVIGVSSVARFLGSQRTADRCGGASL